MENIQSIARFIFEQVSFWDRPLFLYREGGVPILVSQHTIFLAIQQLQTIFFSLFIRANNFLTKKLYEFLHKNFFDGFPLVF